jgi:hypothetical protein
VRGQRELLQVVLAVHAGGRLADLLHRRLEQRDDEPDAQLDEVDPADEDRASAGTATLALRPRRHFGARGSGGWCV